MCYAAIYASWNKSSAYVSYLLISSSWKYINSLPLTMTQPQYTIHTGLLFNFYLNRRYIRQKNILQLRCNWKWPGVWHWIYSVCSFVRFSAAIDNTAQQSEQDEMRKLEYKAAGVSKRVRVLVEAALFLTTPSPAECVWCSLSQYCIMSLDHCWQLCVKVMWTQRNLACPLSTFRPLELKKYIYEKWFCWTSCRDGEKFFRIFSHLK